MADPTNDENETRGSSNSPSSEQSSSHPNPDAPGVGEAESASDGGAGGPNSSKPVRALTQEELARRVEALSKNDNEQDRVADLEEAKLAQRRATQKTKNKMSGLEAAASKRLAKIGAPGAKAKAKGPGAFGAPAERDPALERANAVGRWFEKNAASVAIVGGVLVLGLGGMAGFEWYKDKQSLEASAEFAKAMADQLGRVGDPEKEDKNQRVRDPSPLFKTSDERRDSALAKYQKVSSKFKGTGPGLLARLQEGGLYLDKGDADGALAAYTDVRNSPLAKADVDVRARTIEGSGFAHELMAQKNPAEADKHRDEAFKLYKELEALDIVGYKELGMYDQARILQAKGEREKARDLLKTLHDRLTKPGEDHSYPYLEDATDERLRAIDPTALPPKPAGMMGMGPGGFGRNMSMEQMRRLMEQMGKRGGGAPMPPIPGKP